MRMAATCRCQNWLRSEKREETQTRVACARAHACANDGQFRSDWIFQLYFGKITRKLSTGIGRNVVSGRKISLHLKGKGKKRKRKKEPSACALLRCVQCVRLRNRTNEEIYCSSLADSNDRFIWSDWFDRGEECETRISRVGLYYNPLYRASNLRICMCNICIHLCTGCMAL